MPTVDLKPNANGTPQQWADGTGTSFTEVDAGVDTPDDADYIQQTGGANQSHIFGFEDAPVDFGSTTSITLKVRHRAESFVDDLDTFTVQLIDNGTPIGSPQSATRSDGAWSDESFTDAANWDGLTGGQIDTIEVDIGYVKTSTGMPDAGRLIRVSEVEIVLVYVAGAGFDPPLLRPTRFHHTNA